MPNRTSFDNREKYDHSSHSAAYGLPADHSDQRSPAGVPPGGPTRLKRLSYERRKRLHFPPI